MSSYISPRVIIRNSTLGGKGLFAAQRIKKGELVVDYTDAPGAYVSSQLAEALYNEGKDYMIQVGDDLFFAAVEVGQLEDADFLNHSCDPNCGIKEALKVVAMRDILVGEELTFDYAMTETSDYSMQCTCGSRCCRGVTTGDDWRSPVLRERYAGYFSEYIEKRHVDFAN